MKFVIGRYMFGIKIWRFSIFISWVCDTTMHNWAKQIQEKYS